MENKDKKLVTVSNKFPDLTNVDFNNSDDAKHAVSKVLDWGNNSGKESIAYRIRQIIDVGRLKYSPEKRKPFLYIERNGKKANYTPKGIVKRFIKVGAGDWKYSMKLLGISNNDIEEILMTECNKEINIIEQSGGK